MKKIISKLYVNISRKLSRGKGLGKKYSIVNSTVNKIESSLKSDTAEVWAGKMFLHPNDGLKLSIRGFHDEEEAMMVKNNIKRDEIVVDLGAHIGYYTLMMAKLVGQNGKVFAFEPEPRNLKLLYKNIEVNSYKNIEVVPKAVSDIDGECTLFVGQESFGANKIYMNEVNSEIEKTISDINKTWGGNFQIEIISEWKQIIKERKNAGVKIVHLTMYGQNINNVQMKIRNEDKILIVVGAEKVPREIYEMADYNVAVGNQPHSEISALGILLDRIHQGKQFESDFENPERVIIPQEHGKNVVTNKTTD